MKPMTQIAHDFLQPVLHGQAVCIDGTLGQGNDAAFFCAQGVRRVIAYEIRPEIAVQAMKALNSEVVDCRVESHAQMAQLADSLAGQVDAVMFDFGYYPKEKDSLCTKADSSLAAVQAALQLLRLKGRMALVFYCHAQGRGESEKIMDYLEREAQGVDVLIVRHPFKDNAPWAALVEKRHTCSSIGKELHQK